ncbi:ATP-binding cassette domain-containing protein [Acidisoma sp. L85]|uniref:ATP-binding cassette domain-containing protein n=1 Tax=Acidisoma sp. L85 TaxID=1641850 RepID=UPI00131A85A7|nr:ATP-binding cassette domain-containing protein [Acidisoma sp. L85]
MTDPLVRIDDLYHSFGDRIALAGVSANVMAGVITGLIGPDGAGKTTLLRLLAGLLRPSQGRITVLGHDMVTDATSVHRAIGYMPQRFGLYEDLSVAENLQLSADLHGLTQAVRAERSAHLLRFTGLAPFNRRLAGQLSGGMKQKLGLACALLGQPRLLLLDEPSVGVDPASRRELWAIVSAMLEEGRKDGMGVIWATAYLDEAARCSEVLLLHEGKLLAATQPEAFTAPLWGRVFRLTAATGTRRKVAERARDDPSVLDATMDGDAVRIVLRKGVPVPKAAALGGIELTSLAPRFEDGFIDRLPARKVKSSHEMIRAFSQPVSASASRAAIEVHDLSRRFGTFLAVDHVTLQVARGEIFGLLGPNGAGKSTIFRMLCGLLRPSEGTAQVAGKNLLRSAAAARGRIGYMAQRFSLYAELTVLENLSFFARTYGLPRAQRALAIDLALKRFELSEVANSTSGSLPLGVKQRLALATALLHDPDILFLDEPTSGVDPLTRREFWQRIGDLSASGVAVLVTSHFMDEAENCDRLGIISDGRMIATGTPASLRAQVRTTELPDPSLEDAFIALVKRGEQPSDPT